jgi:hypothetical protein
LSSFSDPLNPGNAIYLLDLGDYMNPGFEDAETSSQGNILPGLSAVPNTAWILPELDPNDDPNLFHNGSFALNLNLQQFMDLQAAGGSKAEWLAYIANPLHWGRSEFHVDDNPDPDLEDDLMNFGFINGGLNVLGIPEPSRALLIGLAFVGAVLRRRRE